MASPFVAGASALLLEKFGKNPAVARNARTLFQTTALAIPSDKTNDSPFQTLTQQGAGLINVYNALNFGTSLSPGELLLNDTAHFTGPKVITLRNGYDQAQWYTIRHVPAGTALTIGEDGVQPSPGPVPLTTDYASVTIIPSRIKLSPHETAQIFVTITPPKTGNRAQFPVYSGFIQVQGSLGETLQSSYLGLNANASELKIIDTTNFYFPFQTPALLDPKGNVQKPGQSYTLQGGDAPTLLYRLAFGTAALYVDLVPSDTTFIPTISKRKNVRDAGTFAQVPIIGQLAEVDYVPRSTNGPCTSLS